MLSQDPVQTISSRPHRIPRKVRANLATELLNPIDAVSGGKGGNKGSIKVNGDKDTSQVTNGVGALSVDDSSRARSKNLDVLAEYDKAKKKNAANFVVIGRSLS
jgi:hypothetical protein